MKTASLLAIAGSMVCFAVPAFTQQKNTADSKIVQQRDLLGVPKAIDHACCGHHGDIDPPEKVSGFSPRRWPRQAVHRHDTERRVCTSKRDPCLSVPGGWNMSFEWQTLTSRLVGQP
jgi:hypothetical protein